jgi:lysozyme family protein
MSVTNFDRSLAFVLKWEGGDTVDTGGETKYGISKKAYPNLDIPNLTLEQAKLIYRRDYWDEAQCNSIGWPWDVILFDTCVNCGVQQALNWFNNSENWQDFLLRRVLHYVTLAKKVKYQPYLRGWLNRTMDLYKEAANALP